MFSVQWCSSAYIGRNEWLSYCRLPVSSKQLGHSPLTSGIKQGTFTKRTAAHWMFSPFLFFWNNRWEKNVLSFLPVCASAVAPPLFVVPRPRFIFMQGALWSGVSWKSRGPYTNAHLPTQVLFNVVSEWGVLVCLWACLKSDNLHAQMTPLHSFVPELRCSFFTCLGSAFALVCG